MESVVPCDICIHTNAQNAAVYALDHLMIAPADRRELDREAKFDSASVYAAENEGERT